MNIINSVMDKITKKNKDIDTEENVINSNKIQCKNCEPNEEITIRSRTEFNPKNYSLDKDFEKTITDKIPANVTDKGQLAFEIYKAVCLSVQYNVGYFIKYKDVLYKNYIEQLKDKKISELSEKDNKIICTNWAELYCYMLSKYNIKSSILEAKVVNKNVLQSYHWCTEFYTDTDTIRADATTGTIDNESLNLTDMCRIKLGLNPVNFVCRNNFKYTDSVKCDAPGFNLLKSQNLVRNILKDDNADIDKLSSFDKVKIINKQLHLIKPMQLDNYSSFQYIKAIFERVFYNYYQYNDLGLSSSFYTEKSKNNFEFFPIMYFKSNNKFYYYFYNREEAEMKNISKTHLLQMIEEGKIRKIIGKDTQIPGLCKQKEAHTNSTIQRNIDMDIEL